MRLRGPCAPLALIVVALVVSACAAAVTTSPPVSRPSSSPSSAPASPAGSPSPVPFACSLLSLTEISSAIQFTVNVETIGGGGRSCRWTFADPNEMTGFNTAKLAIIDPATFEIDRNDQSSGAVTPVTGLGDSAFFVDAGDQGTALSVEVGSRAFTVSVLGVAYTSARSEADEKTLAALVVARI